jgi:hypothetical protein
MNDRYFGCEDCKTYIDAGYRWAYWQLEDPRIVSPGEPVVVAQVLQTAPYWDPPLEDQTDWLCKQVLPAVRRYLTEHRGHRLVYLEADMVLDPERPRAKWIDVSIA